MKYRGRGKHFEIKKTSERIVATQLALEELLKKALQGEGKVYLMEIQIHRQRGRAHFWFKSWYIMDHYLLLKFNLLKCSLELTAQPNVLRIFPILPNPLLDPEINLGDCDQRFTS